jgi:integrase
MTDRSKYLYRKFGRDKTTTYVYFRRPGGKTIPLPSDERSAEFKRAYDACIKALAPPRPAKVVRASPGTDSVAAAISNYVASTDFIKLRPRTRISYNGVLNMIHADLGAGRLGDLDVDAVDIYSELVAKERGPAAADLRVSLLSLIWGAAKKHPQFAIKGRPDPTLDAKRHYKVKRPHRPWSAEAQRKFMAAVPANLRLAKLLLHFGAQRGGDSVKMTWADYDGRGLLVRPEKGKGEAMEIANYHLCPKPLREALDAAPRTAETILVNAYGRPYASARVLSMAISRELRRLGKTFDGLTMHGLRKNAAVDVAGLLVGTAGIKSVTGHLSNAMAEYYAKAAEQRAINQRVVNLWDAALEAETPAPTPKRGSHLRVID